MTHWPGACWQSVLASFDQDVSRALINIGGGLAYVTIVLAAIRPLLTKLQRFLIEKDSAHRFGTGDGLALMALGAWFTDMIGLHAVFGAFIMGSAPCRAVMALAILSPAFSRWRSRCCCRSSSPTRGSIRRSACSIRPPLVDVRAVLAVASPGQRRGLLAGGARDWHHQPRGDGHRHTHECPRADGTHHHQHWPPARRYFRGPLRRARHHGGSTTLMASPMFDRLVAHRSPAVAD